MDRISEIITQITNLGFSDISSLLTRYFKDWSPFDMRDEFEQIITDYLCSYSPQMAPTFTVVAGIPGSGKSKFIERLHAKEDSSLLVQFDAIMCKISRYQIMMKDVGAIDVTVSNSENSTHAKTFTLFELPARIIGYELLKRALSKGYSILLEHSSTPSEHIELYKEISNRGYQVNMFYKKASIGKAQTRINNRRDNHRYTPVNYIHDRYYKLESLIPEYRKICHTFNVIEDDE